MIMHRKKEGSVRNPRSTMDDNPANVSAQRRLAAARSAVDELARTNGRTSIQRLLRDEPQRSERLCIDAAGLLVDLSRQRLPEAALDALLTLAQAADVEGRRNAMFAGEAVNFTEQRPAWHVALRGAVDQTSETMAQVHAEVAATLTRVCGFAERVRAGQWTGAGGLPVRAVVHVGIGGSHLGPQLACEALAPHDAPIDVRFLSNVDPEAFNRATAGLDPRTTLAVIASKSWRTAETARNAAALRRWFLGAGISSDALHRHLVAVTSNVPAALASGLREETIFPLWDWVGGRYSMWSAIGLPIALAIGAAQFRAMLAGAQAMDRHFRDAPPERNAPILMALVSLWNRLILDGGSEVVVPYSDRLRSLVAYLQQLQMESNGKRVDRDGQPLAWQTVPVIWGATGTDAQHSFFQALHQGTSVHPVEFILVVPATDDEEKRGRALLANALAQIEALTCGRQLTPDAHRSAPGNRPSTVLLLETLDAQHFGALIALYEHKTAALGWLWEIDSFDQWGVELGKTLAADIEPLLEPQPALAANGTADRAPVQKPAADESASGSTAPKRPSSSPPVASEPPIADRHPVVEPLIRRLRMALDARNRRAAGPPAA